MHSLRLIHRTKYMLNRLNKRYIQHVSSNDPTAPSLCVIFENALFTSEYAHVNPHIPRSEHPRSPSLDCVCIIFLQFLVVRALAPTLLPAPAGYTIRGGTMADLAKGTPMPKPVGDESRYNPAIDGIRTLAVLGVILYHMNITWAPGGLLGVGVFFTISGFLITGNLMRSWDSRGNLGLSTFWLRRLRRLMPAVIVTVITVWIVAAFSAPDQWNDYRFAGLTAIFYVNNWASIYWGDSYFDQFSISPFEHMWSLSVEEQFYLLWPLILLLLLTVCKGRKKLVAALTALLALIGFSWMLGAYLIGIDATRIYEGTDTRSGGLLVGAVLAIVFSALANHRTDRRKGIIQRIIDIAHRTSADIVGIIGAGGIIAMMLAVPDSSPFLYCGGMLLLALFTAALIIGVSYRSTLINKAFGCKPLAWIGERSYAIYLWHMPIIAFLHEPLEKLPLWLSTAIVMIAALILAALSWVLVEDPIRRHGFFKPIYAWLRGRSSMPRSIWALPVAVMLAVAFIGVPSYFAYQHHQEVIAQQKAERAKQEREAAQKRKELEARLAQEEREAAQLAATTTRCHEIVHLGDSTSLSMFTDTGVLSPEDNAMNVYKSTGATTVVNSSFGARATNQGFQENPSGNESLQEIINAGVDPETCFVIALGINDSANLDKAERDDHGAHIEATLNIIGPNYPVLWITAVVNPEGSPQYYTPEAMGKWNTALYAAQEKHTNLWVYPWDKDIQPDWFIEGDGVHYNQVGSSERSHRFAQAVINAWPMSPERDAAPLLPAKPKPASQRVVTGTNPLNYSGE